MRYKRTYNKKSWKLFKDLHELIESNPRLIIAKNSTDKMYSSVNVNFCNKQKYLLQIYVRGFHKNAILCD